MRRYVAAAAAVLLSSTANAGTLVVSGDEWQLTNFAYGGVYASSTNALVGDMMNRFGGTNYLLLTGNYNVTGIQLTSLTAQLQGAGKTVTQLAAMPTSLSGYDAVFHFGQIVNPADFQSYVQGGGNAFISLGAGFLGGPGNEAAYWNPMLANFGLAAGSSWFTFPGFVNVQTTVAPAGVTDLAWGYGQSIEAIGSPGRSYVRGRFSVGGQDVGLIGLSTTGVPEPEAWALMILGFGVIGGAMRARPRVRVRFA